MITCTLRRLFMAMLAAIFSLSLAPSTAFAVDEDVLWKALRDGTAVAMMRHALAPGTGDPADFSVDDCSTQRNLSPEGRRQAMEIGERFRANGIEAVMMRSSAWCRCLDTASLMALGPVEVLAPLNSFFRQRQNEPAQTAALREWMADRSTETPIVLVTHQVNITALTGIVPSSGEIVVVGSGPDRAVTVLGRL